MIIHHFHEVTTNAWLFPQLDVLLNTESLLELRKIGVLKSRFYQGHILNPQGEEMILPFFGLHIAIGLQFLPVFPHGIFDARCVWPNVLNKDISYKPILTSLYLQKHYFQIRWYWQVTENIEVLKSELLTSLWKTQFNLYNNDQIWQYQI